MFQYLFTVGMVSALALSSAGCVRKSIHQKAIADLQAANQQGSMLAQQLTDCKANALAVESISTDYEARLARADGELNRLKSLTVDLSAELGDTRAELDAMKQRTAREDLPAMIHRELTRQLQEPIKAGKLEVRVLQGRVVVTLEEGDVFERNRTEVGSGGRSLLSTIARALRELPPSSLLVESVEDVLTVGASKISDDWALRVARATEVARLLVAEGVAAEQVTAAVGAGFRKEGAGNASGQRAVRRLEIVVLPPAG